MVNIYGTCRFIKRDFFNKRKGMNRTLQILNALFFTMTFFTVTKTCGACHSQTSNPKNSKIIKSKENYCLTFKLTSVTCAMLPFFAGFTLNCMLISSDLFATQNAREIRLFGTIYHETVEHYHSHLDQSTYIN